MRIDRTFNISLHRGLVTNEINKSEANFELDRIVYLIIGDCIVESDGFNRPNRILVNLNTLNFLKDIGSVHRSVYYDERFNLITEWIFSGFNVGHPRYKIEIDNLIPNNQIALYDERNPIIVGVITIINN